MVTWSCYCTAYNTHSYSRCGWFYQIQVILCGTARYLWVCVYLWDSFLEELTLLHVTLLEQQVQIAECVDLYLIKEWTLREGYHVWWVWSVTLVTCRASGRTEGSITSRLFTSGFSWGGTPPRPGVKYCTSVINVSCPPHLTTGLILYEGGKVHSHQFDPLHDHYYTPSVLTCWLGTSERCVVDNRETVDKYTRPEWANIVTDYSINILWNTEILWVYNMQWQSDFTLSHLYNQSLRKSTFSIEGGRGSPGSSLLSVALVLLAVHTHTVDHSTSCRVDWSHSDAADGIVGTWE